MIEHLYIGEGPCNEHCVQVNNRDNYLFPMREEAMLFIEALEHHFGPLPEGLRLRVKSNPHDFGTYLDVEATFNDSDEAQCEKAYFMEANIPASYEQFRDNATKKWDLRHRAILHSWRPEQYPMSAAELQEVAVLKDAARLAHLSSMLTLEPVVRMKHGE